MRPVSVMYRGKNVHLPTPRGQRKDNSASALSMFDTVTIKGIKENKLRQLLGILARLDKGKPVGNLQLTMVDPSLADQGTLFNPVLPSTTASLTISYNPTRAATEDEVERPAEIVVTRWLSFKNSVQREGHGSQVKTSNLGCPYSLTGDIAQFLA